MRIFYLTKISEVKIGDTTLISTLYELDSLRDIEYIEFSRLCNQHSGVNDTWKNIIQEYSFFDYVPFKYCVTKYTIIFM